MFRNNRDDYYREILRGTVVLVEEHPDLVEEPQFVAGHQEVEEQLHVFHALLVVLATDLLAVQSYELRLQSGDGAQKLFGPQFQHLWGLHKQEQSFLNDVHSSNLSFDIILFRNTSSKLYLIAQSTESSDLRLYFINPLRYSWLLCIQIELAGLKSLGTTKLNPSLDLRRIPSFNTIHDCSVLNFKWNWSH